MKALGGLSVFLCFFLLDQGDAEFALSSNESWDLTDITEDSLLDPLQMDPDCTTPDDCWSPPDSTIEEETVVLDTCETIEDQEVCLEEPQKVQVDKHWGSDPNILNLRDKLRRMGQGVSNFASSEYRDNHRHPIFLMPGLAATRLVAWRHKDCPHNPLLSDIKVQEYVWLNLNLIFQMSTVDERCMIECLRLGLNQTDTDDADTGCKLRPDEGLDAISSLSPGGLGSHLLVGGTNTVYAWLIQWLADNLGYDVSNIVGLPYDWRLSPDKMEERDGFLTLTRRRMEAAVQSNGKPGIMVAHSMGNLIFRYFLQWLRAELREEAHERLVKQAERKMRAVKLDSATETNPFLPGWMQGVLPSFDEWWPTDDPTSTKTNSAYGERLWKHAKIEGDTLWYEWIEKHIWTYVGLSAPLLGAVNPVRASISGENMGVPISEAGARILELSFGSTHTCSPVSSKSGFCDHKKGSITNGTDRNDAKLACLEDIFVEIENSNETNPWENFPALKNLLLKRSDWDTDFPMMKVVNEVCNEHENSCSDHKTTEIGPLDVQSGDVFRKFQSVWNEEGSPLSTKLEQLRESFWDTDVENMLNQTWERPLIKHVVMAYGVDIPTEVGYVYKKSTKDKRKKGSDGKPKIVTALWETAGGRIEAERFDVGRGIGSILRGKKPGRETIMNSHHDHSGDGSVPYLSLSWAHTWLLHSVRALRHSGVESDSSNPLKMINVSHRPKGETEWISGPPPHDDDELDEASVDSKDTGTSHPHGTKYKPEMLRYYSDGISRTTGIQYTTTVIEAIGVEHKETTR